MDWNGMDWTGRPARISAVPRPCAEVARHLISCGATRSPQGCLAWRWRRRHHQRELAHLTHPSIHRWRQSDRDGAHPEVVQLVWRVAKRYDRRLSIAYVGSELRIPGVGEAGAGARRWPGGIDAGCFEGGQVDQQIHATVEVRLISAARVRLITETTIWATSRERAGPGSKGKICTSRRVRRSAAGANEQEGLATAGCSAARPRPAGRPRPCPPSVPPSPLAESAGPPLGSRPPSAHRARRRSRNPTRSGCSAVWRDRSDQFAQGDTRTSMARSNTLYSRPRASSMVCQKQRAWRAGGYKT